MRLFFLHCLTAATFLLSGTSIAFGAAVTVTASGNGIFIINGSQLDGVGGIDLYVVYDNASLASPTVSQGSLISGGGMLLANPNFAPNTIKIAIVRHPVFSGSGQLAVISFATHTGTGAVKVTTNSMISGTGAPISGVVSSSANDFQTSASDATTAAASGSTVGTTSNTVGTASGSTVNTTSSTVGTTSGSTPAYLGTVSMPGDDQKSGSTKPVEPVGVPVTPTEPAPVVEQPDAKTEAVVPEVKTDAAAKPQEIKISSYTSVLERFQSYQGEKSPAIMVALFKKPVATSIRQEPAIAISDGKINVRIIAEAPANESTSPNFALTGAKMISLKKDDKSGSWILEALPQAKSLKATVTILAGGSVIDFPFTLVPPVSGVFLEETEFAAFLKDSNTKSPKFDLNSDGRHDYLDDYIYTAHYLIKKSAGNKTEK